MTLKVAIAGVTGYSGEELLKILAYHPGVEITYVSAKQERSQKIQEIFPYLKGVLDLDCRVWDPEEACKAADMVFLSLPHSVSMASVPAVLKRGKKVIDISADYRFSEAGDYPRIYGFEHTDPVNLKQAVYGLPEMNRKAIGAARLLANPGCYPTGALLGLLPVHRMGLKLKSPCIIDAKSGVTGAGRKASKALMFPEVQENFRAYKVQAHPHEEEIKTHLGPVGWPGIAFVPHLLPVRRGILSTIYLQTEGPVIAEEVRKHAESIYAKEPFVRVLPEGSFPELAHVRGTNQCHIGIGFKERTQTLIVVTAIDNLQKGASGQAVQNMNIMCGLEETAGLR